MTCHACSHLPLSISSLLLTLVIRSQFRHSPWCCNFPSHHPSFLPPSPILTTFYHRIHYQSHLNLFHHPHSSPSAFTPPSYGFLTTICYCHFTKQCNILFPHFHPTLSYLTITLYQHFLSSPSYYYHSTPSEAHHVSLSLHNNCPPSFLTIPHFRHVSSHYSSPNALSFTSLFAVIISATPTIIPIIIMPLYHPSSVPSIFIITAIIHRPDPAH